MSDLAVPKDRNLAGIGHSHPTQTNGQAEFSVEDMDIAEENAEESTYEGSFRAFVVTRYGEVIVDEVHTYTDGQKIQNEDRSSFGNASPFHSSYGRPPKTPADVGGS